MTKIRQNTQVWNSGTYTDTTVPTLAAFETTPVELETDLNNLRSQVNNLLNAQGGNWYDNPFAGPTFDLPISGTASLNNVPIGCFTDLLTAVAVPALQNWVILNVAGSEAPSVPGSLVNTTEGAIVAASAFSGAGFDVFELVERAGSTAISPDNLLLIRDSTTLQPLQSGGRDIFGLLQVESTFTDGANFNDISGGNRVKISFVIINGAGTDLIACPVADIASQSIQYNYPSVVYFKNVDPSCFTGGRGFIDQAASVDVTLQNAYNNGNTIVTSGATNISFSGPSGGGGIFMSTVDAINIGTANATVANTAGTKLSLFSGDGLGTGDGGDLEVVAGDSGVGATGNGGPVAIRAGSATSTSGNGGDATVQAGASTGANEGGLVILTAGASATGTNGYVRIQTSGDEDEVQLLIVPSGTGATVGLYSGASDPNGITSATAGSLYMRSNGQVWVNTTGAMVWEQLQSGVTENRQDVYVNQGVTPVDLTTNAILDLEAAGIAWRIRDDLEANLFSIIEGSLGGTSTIELGAAVDTFDVNAVVNDFDGTTFDVLMTGAVSIDAGAASNFSTSLGDLTLSTGTGSGGAVNVTAGNEAAAAGNNVNINGGNGTAGGNFGGSINITSGSGDPAAASQSGQITLSTPPASDNLGSFSGTIVIQTGDGGPFTGGSSGFIRLTTGDCFDPSVQAGEILLRAGDGMSPGGGSIGGSITLSAGDSQATGEGGVMGDINLTAGNNSGTDPAGDVRILTGSNTSAGGVGGLFSVTIGSSIGAGAGSNITLTAGAAGATGATGGNITMVTGSAAGGDAGYVHVDTTNDEDEHLVELDNLGGTNGSATQMLVGTTNPNGVIAARPSSLYFRNTNAVDGVPGQLYLNVSDVAGESTVWSPVVTSSTSTTRTYVSGTASAGIPATTDISDLGPASNITLDANSGSFPVMPSTATLFFQRASVWVNGILQRNGVSAVRSGTQTTAIQLNFALVTGDEVAIEIFSA